MNFELLNYFARGYQKVMKQGAKVLDWSPPLLLRGEVILDIMPDILSARNSSTVFWILLKNSASGTISLKSKRLISMKCRLRI